MSFTNCLLCKCLLLNFWCGDSFTGLLVAGAFIVAVTALWSVKRNVLGRCLACVMWCAACV